MKYLPKDHSRGTRRLSGRRVAPVGFYLTANGNIAAGGLPTDAGGVTTDHVPANQPEEPWH